MALQNFDPEAGKKGQEKKKRRKKRLKSFQKTGETCLLKRTLKEWYNIKAILQQAPYSTILVQWQNKQPDTTPDTREQDQLTPAC